MFKWNNCTNCFCDQKNKVYIGLFGMEYAHGNVLNLNNERKRLHTLTYKWMGTLTEKRKANQGEKYNQKDHNKQCLKN